MKTVMFYEIAPDGISKAMTHSDGHRGRLKDFHEKKGLAHGRSFC